MVFVEISPETELPIRILKHWSHASQLDPDIVRHVARSVAVGYIRQQVFEKAKRGMIIKCEFCGNIITTGTGHMHEVLPRGKGGEISVDNGTAICSECHIGKTGEHRDRYWGGRRNDLYSVQKETSEDSFQ